MKRAISSKNKRTGLIPILVFVSFALTIGRVSPVSAISPDIVDTRIGINGKHVVVNARLVDGFAPKILEAIKNGVSIGFTFEVELREDGMLMSSLVGTNKVRHQVKFDSLKKLYQFSESWENITKTIVTKKVSQYQKLMLTLENIPIAPTYKLSPNEKYYARVKADLETDRFWFPFNYIFFFVPFRAFETSWAQTSTLSIGSGSKLSKQGSGFVMKRDTIVPSDIIRSFHE